MTDTPPKQRRLVGKPWPKGKSGNPYGRPRKPRHLKERAIIDFVEAMQDMHRLKAVITLQGKMLDDILQMVMERATGVIDDHEMMSRAAATVARQVTEMSEAEVVGQAQAIRQRGSPATPLECAVMVRAQQIARREMERRRAHKSADGQPPPTE